MTFTYKEGDTVKAAPRLEFAALYKAGKINEALKRTTEEFILILDPDHIVFPNFLHQTLGFFHDEKVGFVQVS